MKHMGKAKYCLIFLIFIFNGCKKEANKDSGILLSKSWRYGILDKNPATNPSGQVLFNGVLDCMRDDLFTFKSNGELVIDRGSDKCDSNEIRVEVIVYSYDRENKELIISTKKYTVAEEAKEQMKYYLPLPPGSGFNNLVFLLQ